MNGDRILRSWLLFTKFERCYIVIAVSCFDWVMIILYLLQNLRKLI